MLLKKVSFFTIVLLLLTSALTAGITMPDMSEFTFRDNRPACNHTYHKDNPIRWDGALDDVYFYDVEHYYITLDLTDTTDYTLNGSVAMTATVQENSFDEIIIDLHDELEITEMIYTDGSSTNYSINLDNDVTRVGMRVYVSIPSVLTNNDEFTLETHYNGPMIHQVTPNGWYDNGLLSGSNSGKVNLYTLSEPEESRFWWPNKNIPGDKATTNMDLTVWDYQIGTSNGSLEDVVVDGNKKTFKWYESFPVSNYLVAIAVYPYEVNEDTYTSLDGNTTMPVISYLFPGEYSGSNATNIDNVPNMITALAEKFGEYAYITEKYAMVSMAQGGGMEHQTISTMGGYYESVVIHELGHMWFGDQITCKTWNDTWINEGGATYLQGIWEEYQYGMSGMSSYLAGIKSSALGSTDPLNAQSYALTGDIYYKGAWVYHMVRGILGDDAFFATMDYILNESEYSYNSISGEEYISILGSHNGLNFDWFWDQWINHGGHPEYTYATNVSSTTDGSVIDIQIGQEQYTSGSNTLYKMPVQVNIEFTDGSDTLLVIDTEALEIQTLSYSFDKQIASSNYFEFDPENWILCEKRQVAFTSIDDDENVANAKFQLSNNYPNPFNGYTKINFVSNVSSAVTFVVFNQTGQEIFSKNLNAIAGIRNNVSFNAEGLNSGVFYYQIKDSKSGNLLSNVKKMLYVK